MPRIISILGVRRYGFSRIFNVTDLGAWQRNLVGQKNINILVINVARIGDSLLVTPVLRAIKASCPEGRLGCLAHPKRADVLRGLTCLDSLGTITPKRALWRGWFDKHHWDYAMVYGHDASLIRYAARVAPRVIAFDQSSDEINRLLWRAVPVPENRENLHVIHEYLLLPATLEIAATEYRLAYVPAPHELEQARIWMHKSLLPGTKPLIGFQVASFPSKSYRDWPLENFAELGARILAAYPTSHILIMGGKECRSKALALKQQLGGRATAVAGRFDLRATAALMQHLNLYVGVDTGPTHLASALKIPMVALYHCFHRARRLAPLENELCRAIDHPRRDSECNRTVSMSEIGVNLVWEAADNLLRAFPNNRDAATALPTSMHL